MRKCHNKTTQHNVSTTGKAWVTWDQHHGSWQPVSWPVTGPLIVSQLLLWEISNQWSELHFTFPYKNWELKIREKDKNCAREKTSKLLDYLHTNHISLLLHILSGSRLCIPTSSRRSDSCSFLEFQNSKLVPFPSRNIPTSVFFCSVFPLCLIGQPFWNHLVQHCSNIKVTGGDLSCRGAVRLTVTQLTDSQTTRDLFSYFFTCQTLISPSMWRVDPIFLIIH